ADRVVDGDGAGDEVVGDFDLDARAGRLRPAGQPPEQGVVVVAGVDAGDRLGGVGPVGVARPAAASDQQAVRLGGVAQDAGGALGAQEIGHVGVAAAAALELAPCRRVVAL